jgi:tetratricopeptide (TPR) repeat protein
VGELPAEVVRLVSPQQAAQWQMPAGFGVQFIGLRPDQKDALEALARGEAPVAGGGPTLPDDPIAAQVLQEFKRKTHGDHYFLLGVPLDVEVQVARARGREVVRRLLDLQQRPLSLAQQQALETCLARVREASDVLGTPARRVAFDGAKLNWRGVERCLQGGLRVPELEAARAAFLKVNPGVEARSRLHLITASSYEKVGAFEDALKCLELALNVDPLLLEAHQRRMAILKHQARQARAE